MTASAGTKRPAVFLDRDGTIIEDLGDLFEPSQVVFFGDTIPSLLRLSEKFELFIVTNQPGVAAGVLTLQDVGRVNDHVVRHLKDAGIAVKAVYVCPHCRADGCVCIKPNPYFLRKAAEEYRIDLAGSFVIGDHPHDVLLAQNAGAIGVYVLTGHGSRHQGDIPKDIVVAADIKNAVDFILQSP